MALENILNPETSHLLGAAITASAALSGLFFKWLSGNFKRLEVSMEQLKSFAQHRTEMTETLLNDHEDHDQTRHEENLHRFEKISVALARLGSKNGTYSKDKD